MSRDDQPTIDERGRSTPPTPTHEPAELPARYASGDEIARGGMGRVVEATDTLLGRAVAIKEALTTDPDALRRFARETRITARLEHPSIVPVYDAGIGDDGKPYYVMRKVSGRPLDQLVEDGKSLRDRLALLPHVLAAAQAVAHAHRRGVLHRDLKPTNILVGDLGETVVIDWGLAKVVGEADEARGKVPPSAPDLDNDLRTRIGAVIGTPGFMPPEQLRGETVDARGDVYALGATLHYLFTQQPPHASASIEDMMVAAATGPARSLAEVVPDLPPELATIVDKALEFDQELRYPDAAALAEDLQRFLTGQLVASHRYSRRERLVRFVRRNRVAVIVATAAMFTLAGGAWYAIARIIDARDVAVSAQESSENALRDAQAQKKRADDRADELTLMQARSLLDKNPTEAVALVKPLARGEHWRAARAIGAAARAAGVAWEMPGAATPRSLAISPDGRHAMASGLDGVVRYYDLVHHTTRELLRLVPDRNCAFADDDHLVMWRARELAIVDITTGARRDIVVPDAVNWAVGTPAGLYWVTDRGALWHLAKDGAPEHIPIDDTIVFLEASRDGRWLAASGHARFHVVDIARTPPVSYPFGDTEASSAAFDPNTNLVAARVGGDILVIELTSPPRLARRDRAPNVLDVAQVGDTTYAMGSYLGLRTFSKEGAGSKLVSTPVSVGLRAANFDTVIGGSPGGHLVVLSPTREMVISAPVDMLHRVAAHPAGRYIVGAAPGHLLVWDLDQVMPRRREVGSMGRFSVLSGDQLVVERLFEDWDWIDLTKDVTWHIEGMAPVMPLIGNLAGDRAVAIEPGASRGFEIRRGEHAVLRLADPIDIATYLPDGKLLVATPSGTLVAYDATRRERTVVTSHPSAVAALQWQTHWLAAQFEDGTLWRRNVDTGKDDWHEHALEPGTRMTIQLATDGRLFAVRDRKMLLWNLDGTLTEHATLPAPVFDVLPFTTTAVVVITADRAAYVVSTTEPNRVAATISAGVEVASVSGERGLAVASHDDGRIEVVDLLGGVQWSLGRLSGGAVHVSAQISPRGDLVVAQKGQDELLLFPLDVPDSPAETARWLDDLTNATTEHGPASLTWRHDSSTGRSPPSVIQRDQ